MNFEKLYWLVEGLPIGVRAFRVLQENDIKYVYELVRLKRADLLEFRGLGVGTLAEIEEVLEKLGLSLETSLPYCPRVNLDNEMIVWPL